MNTLLGRNADGWGSHAPNRGGGRPRALGPVVYRSLPARTPHAPVIIISCSRAKSNQRCGHLIVPRYPPPLELSISAKDVYLLQCRFGRIIQPSGYPFPSGVRISTGCLFALKLVKRRPRSRNSFRPRGEIRACSVANSNSSSSRYNDASTEPNLGSRVCQLREPFRCPSTRVPRSRSRRFHGFVRLQMNDVWVTVVGGKQAATESKDRARVPPRTTRIHA